MTKEEAIDWLYRLKSEIKIFMPYQWQKPFEAALYMANKALEQDPREITFEDVKGYCKPRCLTIVSNELLHELTHPKIKALEPRWISVSERLPKDSGEYLVSVIDKEDEDDKQVGVAWFAHKKDYAISESEWRELGIDETVVAWMPLPKAYREVEE